MRPSLHDDGHRRDVVGEPGFRGRVQRIDDRVHVMQRLERRKGPACDVVARRHDVKEVVHAPVVRAAKSRVRSRRHPRVLVGEVPELAPLPSVERLAERQAVDDVRYVCALGVLTLLRPV